MLVDNRKLIWPAKEERILPMTDKIERPTAFSTIHVKRFLTFCTLK